MSNTKKLLNMYLATRPEKTSAKIRSMIDRHEVYDFEKHLGKSVFEMTDDEIITMFSMFRRRGAQKSKLSAKTYEIITSLFRSFFNWYIDSVEVIRNPFNSSEFKRRIKTELSNVRDVGVSKEAIAKAINRLGFNENPDYAEYCEAILRMAYEGFANTYDIVNFKEANVDHLRRSVTLRGCEHLLSSRLYELLVKIHNKETMPASKGDFTMVDYDGSYFKFPTRDSFASVERESVFWQSYLSRVFKNKISPCFEFPISFRDVYICGFYEHLARKYGREETKDMILSEKNGKANMILLEEARMYGMGVNLSPINLKRDIRQCIFQSE